MFNNISNWGQEVNWSNDQIKQRLYCISSNLGRRSSGWSGWFWMFCVVFVLSDWARGQHLLHPSHLPAWEYLSLSNNLHILYSGNSNEGTPPGPGYYCRLLSPNIIMMRFQWNKDPAFVPLPSPSCPACRDINIKTKRGNILQFPGWREVALEHAN